MRSRHRYSAVAPPPYDHAQTPNFSGKGLRLGRLTAALVEAEARPLADVRTLPLIGEAS